MEETVISKTYKKRMSIFWWASRWSHIKFISRELTSVFVGGYAFVFLMYVRSILQGPEAFQKFSSLMRSPLMIVVHVIAFVGLLFHSITWFNLAPQAMGIKIGDKNIPGVVIALMNYGGWVVISFVLVWLLSQG